MRNESRKSGSGRGGEKSVAENDTALAAYFHTSSSIRSRSSQHWERTA